MEIRLTIRRDIEGISSILDETGLFPRAFLPDMIEGFFTGTEDAGVWMTASSEGRIFGFCYAVPEKLTNGSWNMLAIAVSTGAQGKGTGSMMVASLEGYLLSRGARLIIVDTSGMDAYLETREFYKKNNYKQVACIPDFWDIGDDKITFMKKLAL